MRRLIAVSFAFAVMFAAGLPAQRTPSSLAITGVTVIDGSGARAAPSQTVVIAADRIQAVGPAGSVRIPAGARVIQASGKFLIPGLWDMHVHLEMVGEETFPLFLVNGVTSVRDMGSEAPWVLARRRAVTEGKLVGPRIRTAGPILESARWLQAVARIQQQQGTPADEMIAPKRIGVGSPADAERAIDSLRKLGVDFVKVRTVANPATYFAILREARRAGLEVVGHNPPVDLALASDSGQRSIEDGFFPPLDSLTPEERTALFARFVANGTWSDPTLVAGKAFRFTPDSVVLATLDDSTNRRQPLQRYASARLLGDWRRQVDMKRFESPLDWDAIRRGNLRDFREMQAAGVRFVAGTDTPSVLVFPGFGLHDELVLLVEELGLSPLEALQAATANAAELLGLQDSLGTIAQGKVADLVLLEANPLEDIRNTRRIEAVVAGGKLYGRRDLDALLARVEGAARRSH